MKILLFLSCFLLPLSGYSASHYIRPSATGATNGSSWANAWTNFASVVWTRGDTYYIAGGTYVGDISIGVAESGSTRVILKKANSTDNSGDAGWSSSFESDQAIIQLAVGQINNSYFTIDGVTGANRAGYGIKFYGPSVGGGNAIVNLADNKSFLTFVNIEIEGPGFGYATGASAFKHNSTSGLTKGHTFTNIWIHDVSQNGTVWVNVLGTSFSDYGLLYDKVTLDNCGYNVLGQHGQGIQIGSGAAGSSNSFWLIRNSTFFNVVGTADIAALGFSTNSDIRIYNNIFYNTNLSFNEAAGGVWTNYTSLQDASSPGVLYFSDTAQRADRVQIINNTFHKISRNTVYFGNISSNNEVVNNLFVDGHFNLVHQGVTGSYNDYYLCLPIISSGIFGVPYGELGQQTETASPFVDIGRDFRLVGGANASSNGTNRSDITTTDIQGTTISTWHMGAYTGTNSPAIIPSIPRTYQLKGIRLKP